MAEFLQDTIEEIAVTSNSSKPSKKLMEFSDFVTKVFIHRMQFKIYSFKNMHFPSKIHKLLHQNYSYTFLPKYKELGFPIHKEFFLQKYQKMFSQCFPLNIQKEVLFASKMHSRSSFLKYTTKKNSFQKLHKKIFLQKYQKNFPSKMLKEILLQKCS